MIQTAAALPDVLRRYVERSLPEGPIPRQMGITEEGEMWLKSHGLGMRFTATQFFAVERVAFSWRARFPVAGPLTINVVDGYADGDGKLEVRVLGLPVQRQRGAEVVAGEGLRYLAEPAWVPYAIAHKPRARGRELDERTVEVAAPSASPRSSSSTRPATSSAPPLVEPAAARSRRPSRA